MPKPIYFGLTKIKKIRCSDSEAHNEEWFCAYDENNKILPIIKVSDTNPRQTKPDQFTGLFLNL